MRKPALIILLILLGAGVVGVLIMYLRVESPRPTSGKPAKQEAINTRDWPLYSNETLRVALKHPQRVIDSEMVLFQTGNILFVTTASSSLYIHRAELPVNDDDAILKKAAIIEQQYPMLPTRSWKIWVADARTDNDLEQIIRKWFGDEHGFGDGCKLGEKTPSAQDGVYDVGVTATRGEQNDASGSCWINWMADFKFSPKYQRAAIWDGGQEAQFTFCNDANNCDADSLMAQSFTFIKQK